MITHHTHPIRGFLLSAWLVLGSLLAVATAADTTEQNVTFRNGDVTLQGTLLMPKASGAVPVIVYLHGSGPMTRQGFRPYAEEFAKLGIGGFFYDKRGTGESGGSWLTASLDDLASDALAAIRHLKGDRQLQVGRIGFWGISQAGWIGPYATARSPDVDFLVLITGGGATPRESEIFSYRQEFTKAGLSDAQQEEGFAVLDTYFDYLDGKVDKARLQSTLDGLRGAPLEPLAEQLGRMTPSEENRVNWRWVANYDPAEDIAKIKVPVLLLMGALDNNHPTEIAMQRWQEGLATAGNQDVTIVEFPDAGHGIRKGSGHDRGGRTPFADGYQDVQIGWLWRHLVAGQE